MTHDTLRLSDLPADISNKIAKFRVEARAEIDALEADLQKKETDLHEIKKSVCLDDAASLIEASFRRELEKKRAEIQRRAEGAIYFSHHAPTSHVYLNSVGEVRVDHRGEYRLDIFPYDTTALDILSVVWSDQDIKAFAKKSAIAAGAKPAPEGRTVQEIESLSAVLVDEIKALYTARQEALKVLSGLIDIALIPFVVKAVPSAPPEPSPPPSVRTRNKDGIMVEIG